MWPTHFYFSRKSIQPRFSYTPTGDLDLNQLLRNKPYWRQSLAATIKENKTLILADWSAESWSNEQQQQVIEKFFELMSAGFSIHAWQAGQLEELNRDNLVQLLKEPQFMDRVTTPVMPKDLEAVVIAQLPNVAKDNILILDDYQIQGLIHPEVFTYPRELNVSLLLKYTHNKDSLIPILGKMNPPITGFTDTEMSEESYQLLEQLQRQLPEISIKSQFKSAKLTKDIVAALVADGKALVARRVLCKEQLQDLEEVTLDGLSVEALIEILPYLRSVKKLILLNFTASLPVSDTLNSYLPHLEKIKLVGVFISSTVLAAIIKNSPLLAKLDIHYSKIIDTEPLSSLASQRLHTIKIKGSTISKKNYQDLLLNHKINRILFSDAHIFSDTLTEIKDRDLSSIKVLEIERCSCDAVYLNQMFELLPQLEHVCIHGGQIARFTNTFSLKSLKILDIDLQRFNDIASAFNDLKIEQLILVDTNTRDVPQLDKLNLSRMRYFRIANNQLNHIFLEDVLQRATSLKHLDLAGCTNLYRLEHIRSLASIDTLNLSNTDITVESLALILEHAPNLKRLDLSGCSQLVLTPKLRELMQRIQVYYPEHIKIERKKPDYSQYALSTDQRFQAGSTLQQLLGSLGQDTTTQAEANKNGASLDNNQQQGFGGDGDTRNIKQKGSVDGNTSNKEQQYSVKVVFFPLTKDAPIPAVSQYREHLFNDLVISQKPCSVDAPFKVQHAGDLQLQSCDPIVCLSEVLNEAPHLEHSPVYQHYYGKTSLELTEEWRPLPSLSAQEQLTHYHIEPNNVAVELCYSLRDNQHYIRSKESKSVAISMDYLLNVPLPVKRLPPEVQALVDSFAGSKLERGFGQGSLVLDVPEPTGMDYLNAILTQKKGACRHRAIAFYYLMKERFPERSVRIVGNTVHMQAEVLIDGEWLSCNLGGYPAKLNLNMDNDPRKKESLGTNGTVSQNVELLKEDAQIAQFLQTWKKRQQTELSLQTYCEQITEPKQQKKYLIETSNADSLQALSLAIKAHCKQNDRPFFYIQKPDNLTCSAPFVTSHDKVGMINDGPGGPLHSFLTQSYDKANPPVLIINADQFETDDLVQHNSLWDDKPQVDGTPLPDGTIVILLRNSSKANFTLGEDLSSRLDVIERCPVTDKALNLAYPAFTAKGAEEELGANVSIDLFQAESWESLLLGQWTINGNELYFEEGLLQEALKKHSVITLRNGLWENPSFQYFWQEAVQRGAIDYEGQHIELPSDFAIVRADGYEWKQLAASVEFKEGINSAAECLNPNLLNRFFSEYECIEEINGMKKNSGLIQQAAGRSLTVTITRELDEHAWARLLTECNKHKVQLVCHCPPGIVLPEPLQHQYQDRTQQQTTVFDATTCSACMIIKSSDRDTTVSQLSQQLKGSVFIDVSELESFDLLKQIHGSYDKEAHRFHFKRVEKVLNQALKKNKNVILTGQCSNALLDSLMPLLLNRSHDSHAQGTVALVVENTCEYKFQQFINHEVRTEEKVAALKRNHSTALIERLSQQQLESESLSQLQARLRYLKMHPLEQDSSNAWDGLHVLSSQIELASFDLNNSEENAKATIKQRTTDILSRLVESPTLYLSGLTGVGKTTFIEKHLSKEPNVTVYYGEEQLKVWAEDHSDQVKIIFIDEANISQRQWSEFEGLFVDPPSIVISGRHYLLEHSHKVIFAGNPLNYGNERQLATLFKRHGNAKVFEPMTGEFIYEMILKPLFDSTALHDQSKEISQKVLLLYRYLVNLSTNEVLISARELQLIVLLILACHHRGVHKDMERIAAHYIYQIGSTMVPYEHRNDFDALFKPQEPLYAQQQNTVKLEHSNYLITPSRQDLYQLICDLLDLRHYKQVAGHNEAQKFGGLGGIILEGEPGIGKSELVRAVLQEYLFQEATLHHEPEDTPVFYQIPIGMRKKQKEELLLKGLNRAAVLLIDEINSAPTMERWFNDLLMNKNPVTKAYPDEPGLTLFGTQNPVTMPGRQKSSNALNRRVLHYTLPHYPPEEMVAILVNEGCTVSAAEQMVKVYVHLVNYARQNYLSPAPTFRDLLRLARIASKLNQMEALNTFYASVDKISLRQALIKTENRFDSDTVLALTKYLTPETLRIFDGHLRLFHILIERAMTEKKVEFILQCLTLIVPESGEMDEERIQYFMLLCDLNNEELSHFERLNEVFAHNKSMLDDFFKTAKGTDVPTITRLVVDYVTKSDDLLDLLAALLAEADTQLLSACMSDAGGSLEFIRAYLSMHPDTNVSMQLALIKTHSVLLQQESVDPVCWTAALLQVDPEKLFKLQDTIATADLDSIFDVTLLKKLKNDDKVAYIRLVIEDEQTRHFFLKHSSSDLNLVRKSITRLTRVNSQEIIALIDHFQDYPDLLDYLFSNELKSADLLAMCTADPQQYAELIKAYEEKNQITATSISPYIKLLELSRLLNHYAPKSTLLWRALLLDSTPEQIAKMHDLLSNRSAKEGVLNSVFRDIDLFVSNQQLHLSPQDELSYCTLLRELSVAELEPFQQLTSLLSSGLLSISSLWEQLKTIPLQQLLQTVVLIKSRSEHQTMNEGSTTQCIELYDAFAQQAPGDQAIWYPILLEASLEELQKMHQWMKRYQQSTKSEFLNLVYSKAYRLQLNVKGSFTEDSLLADTSSLLNDSAKQYFTFDAPVQFSAERVRLIHHLEQKTFVTPSSSTLGTLWTELKNSAFLNAIYDAYLQFLGRKNDEVQVLLLVASELTAVPTAAPQPVTKMDRTLVSDLSGVVASYLHSFWIRDQRRNSARSLLGDINNKNTNYLKILNSIHTARNEVFTNDTEQERYMHRFGSSRYYETLNQVEGMLISHWIKDKNAISQFKAYLNHYETTLEHSKQCLLNAINHENEANQQHYDDNTPFDCFPGYIRALKREVRLREQAFAQYKLMLDESVDVFEPESTTCAI